MEEAGAGEEEAEPRGPADANPAARPPAPPLPSSRAPERPGPPLPPQQPPAPGLPGRAAAGPPWEDRGARFLLLLPPAPRAEAVARETGLAVRGGLGPFRAPCILAARPSQPLGRGRGRRAEGRRGAPQPTCGPGPRHRGDKDTRNHHSRCCRHHRKRLSGSATTGRKLPLSRIWSLPPLHRLLPSPTPACHPAPTVERKCAFPDRMRASSLQRHPRWGPPAPSWGYPRRYEEEARLQIRPLRNEGRFHPSAVTSPVMSPRGPTP
ncbi:unnamed protein product [Nyctereutes procyonoides]|uniref:(raccoon dog) hypothetical protein n=1 Tax=Nyctereutes procyonoides TaxID=34880 RepID=A0A811ZDR2_NYCPR|nr:unnamed protein product [Nyctereutes procyonoides]